MSPEQPGAVSPREPAVPGATDTDAADTDAADTGDTGAADTDAADTGDTGATPRSRPGVEPVEPTTGTAAVGRGSAKGPGGDDGSGPRRLADPPRRGRVRARKVRRIVRHIEPWSVLKVSVLFFISLFVILCVASAVLWNAARSAGTIDSVESFITSLGFGNCEDIEGAETTPSTTITTVAGPVDQLDPEAAPDSTVVEPPDDASTLPDEDGDCAEGQVLVGGFEFEDQRIFQAFLLGGVVLVLAGSAGAVVMVLLFNLISDLTGGVRVTVLEEEPPPRPREAGSPGPRLRD